MMVPVGSLICHAYAAVCVLELYAPSVHKMRCCDVGCARHVELARKVCCHGSSVWMDWIEFSVTDACMLVMQCKCVSDITSIGSACCLWLVRRNVIGSKNYGSSTRQHGGAKLQLAY